MPGELHLDSAIMELVRDAENDIISSGTDTVRQFLYTRQAEHSRKAEILAILDTITEFSLPVSPEKAALLRLLSPKKAGFRGTYGSGNALSGDGVFVGDGDWWNE